MPTQCRPVSFGFQGCRGRKVTAAFDGGSITSNAGALLLRGIDRSIGLFDRVAACSPCEIPDSASSSMRHERSKRLE